jgi:hypothetical protein
LVVLPWELACISISTYWIVALPPPWAFTSAMCAM